MSGIIEIQGICTQVIFKRGIFVDAVCITVELFY